MIAAWLAVAFLWGAAIALSLTTWYFRREFVELFSRTVDLSQRIAKLEAEEVRGTIIVASSEQEVLQRIADALEADDDEPTVKH